MDESKKALLVAWVTGIVRALLSSAFGALAAHGVISEGVGEETIIAVSGFAVNLIWSFWEKRNQNAVVAALKARLEDAEAKLVARLGGGN